MDEEVFNRLSKFKLKQMEEKGITLKENDISRCREKGERSLLGKICFKEAKYTGLRNTLCQLWCQKGHMRVKELGQNFYQFVFTRNEEMDRVLLKRPWYFENQMLVIHLWEPGLKGAEECFRNV